MSRRRTVWILISIILAGAVLRLFHLGLQSLWHDEAVSLAIADRLNLAEKLTNQGHSSHPPLYYLLLWRWIRLAGISDFTARIPSTLAGLLTIPLIYQAGRLLFDRRVGIWSALFMAVLPFQIYYAQEVRMYTLLGMLTTVSLIFFVRAIRRNTWQMWGAYWFCSILGLYTHYFFAFIILVYHLYLWLNWLKYRHLWRAILIIDGILFLAFLPQIAIFIDQSQNVLGSSYWLGKPNPLAFFTTIYFFFVSYTVPPQWNFGGMFVLLSLLATGLYELIRRPRGNQRSLGLLVMGAFLPLLAALAISQIKPIFLERTLIICTPFLILLLGRMVSGNHFRSPVPYLTLILGLFVVISLYRLYFDSTTHKPPLRQTADQIASEFRLGDMAIHTSVGSFLPFLFYNPPADHYLLWGEPHPRKPAETYELFEGRVAERETVNDYQRIWLVVFLDHSVQYQRTQVGWFDDRLVLLKNYDIDGVVVRLYSH